MSTIQDYITYQHTPKLMAKIERFRPAIKKYANQYGIDPTLVEAVVFKESRFNPNAHNSEDAKIGSGTFGGLGQFMKATGRRYGLNEANYHDPNAQLNATAHYLADINKRRGGDIYKIGKEYNGAGVYGNDLRQFYSWLKTGKVSYNNVQPGAATPSTQLPNTQLPASFNAPGMPGAYPNVTPPDYPDPVPGFNYTPTQPLRMPDLGQLATSPVPKTFNPMLHMQAPIIPTGFEDYKPGLGGLEKLRGYR